MTNIHSIPCGVQLYGKELSDLMDMDIDEEEDLDFIFDDDEEEYEWASTTGEPRRKRWEHTRLNWSLHVLVAWKIATTVLILGRHSHAISRHFTPPNGARHFCWKNDLASKLQNWIIAIIGQSSVFHPFSTLLFRV